MKDIIYSINLGLIGTEESNLEIFIVHLKEMAFKYSSENLIYEFFLYHEGIPLKLRTVIANGFEDLFHKNESFNHFDIIIVAVNLYNNDSISNYTIQNYSEFRNYFFFNGISVFAGVDPFLLLQENPPYERSITEFNLIQKTRELEFHYCFKIQDKKKDITDLFNKILNYIILKLKFLNPELFKRVKPNRENSDRRVSL